MFPQNDHPEHVGEMNVEIVRVEERRVGPRPFRDLNNVKIFKLNVWLRQVRANDGTGWAALEIYRRSHK